MVYDILQFLILLTIAFLLIMLAKKLKVSYPVFLVIAGLGIGYIPGFPKISVDPEIIFLIILPPLLYNAAWYTSWNDFFKWRRPIALLAFGLVMATSFAVALFTSYFIPGFTLAMGFLLGGIISPPDATATTSILENIKVPRRIGTIVKGESLVNDAVSIIVLRFALAAVVSGSFYLSDALGSFLMSTFFGVLIGLAIGFIMYLIHHFLPTTASIDAAFTLITPYFMYIAAEQMHFSGVMAVVSGGLFLSHKSNDIFSDGQSRLQSLNVWATLIIVFNAFIFILIGLELPVIVNGLEGYSLWEASVYGLLISLIVILIRLAWVYPSIFIPRWISKSVRRKEANPGWKGPLIISWSGMRGVVSLAAALSIPMLVAEDMAFPKRNLIIFITFVVILITLVFQGLTLPFLIKRINIYEFDPTVPESKQEASVKIRLLQSSLNKLNESYSKEVGKIDSVHSLKLELENRLAHASRILESDDSEKEEYREADIYNIIFGEILKVKRQELQNIREEKKFSDEVIRREEMQIDLSDTQPLIDKKYIIKKT